MTNSELQLKSLTKGQRRYLQKFACALCDQPLDHPRCGSIYGPPCEDSFLVEKRACCLKEYKPRKSLATGQKVG